MGLSRHDLRMMRAESRPCRPDNLCFYPVAVLCQAPTCHSRWPPHPLHDRHPLAVIRSFSKVLPATLEETCYPALLSLASELRTSR